MKLIVKHPETSHIDLEIIVGEIIISRALDPCSLTHARSLDHTSNPRRDFPRTL